MQTGVKDRVAVVSGASKGIGRAIAAQFLQEGAKVVACARGEESLRDFEREFKAFHERLVTVPADVTNRNDVKRVFGRAVEVFGGVDILVNNAGGVRHCAAFPDIDDADWISTYELNVMSVVHSVKEALPFLRRSAAPRIINIASISGVEPGTFNPHYAAAKAAQINLSKYLANFLAKDGILVNVVCPGSVHSHAWDTNIAEVARQKDVPLQEFMAAMEKEEMAKIPLGRIGEGEDVAGLVVFLASERAGWVTGSCFHINGGKLRSMC